MNNKYVDPKKPQQIPSSWFTCDIKLGVNFQF